MNEIAKILFVDDEVNVLNSIRRSIFDEENWECFFASSGLEALAILSEHSDMSVVVSDMRMPVMDGLTLFKEIKELYPLAVRVVLSGYTQLQQLLAVINRGEVYRFITKPWSMEQGFRSAIEDAIAHHRMLLHTSMIMETAGPQVGDITAPEALRELQLRNKAIDAIMFDQICLPAIATSPEELAAQRALMLRIRDWMILKRRTPLAAQFSELVVALGAAQRAVLSANTYDIPETREVMLYDGLLHECYHAFNDYMLMNARCQLFVHVSLLNKETEGGPVAFRMRAHHGATPPSEPDVMLSKAAFFNKLIKLVLPPGELLFKLSYKEDLFLDIVIV